MEAEFEVKLEKHRNFLIDNREELSRLHALSGELVSRMEQAEQEMRQLEQDYENLKRKNMENADKHTVNGVQEYEAATQNSSDDNVFYHGVQVQDAHDYEKIEVRTESETLAGPEEVPSQVTTYDDVDVRPVVEECASGNVEEVTSEMTQQETEHAIKVIETITETGTIQSEEGKALVEQLADHLEVTAVDEQGRERSLTSEEEAKVERMRMKLQTLKEDLASNRDETRLSKKDLIYLNSQLADKNYKTRTLRQIRQGNTRNRITVFEQL